MDGADEQAQEQARTLCDRVMIWYPEDTDGPLTTCARRWRPAVPHEAQRNRFFAPRTQRRRKRSGNGAVAQ